MWQWGTVLAARWKYPGEHINLLESRAYGLALKWHTRAKHRLGTRFPHLVDSKVTMASSVKGRSSSQRRLRGSSPGHSRALFCTIP